MFPRGSLHNFYSAGGRGVTILANEPSRAAFELSWIFLYAFIKIRRKLYKVLSIFFLIAINVIIIKSLIGLALSLLIIVILNRRYIFAIPIFLLCIFISISFLISNGIIVGRISQFPMEWRNINTILSFIYEQSGHRAVALHLSYQSLLDFPFGYGLGGWFDGQFDMVKINGYTFEYHDYYVYDHAGSFYPIRAEGYIPNLIIEFGIFGFLLSSFILNRIHQAIRGNSKNMTIFLFFIASLCLLGPVGHPYRWFFVGMAIRIKSLKKINEKT